MDNFYEKCDGKVNAIGIIQTPQNKVFVEWTSLKWDKSNVGKK